MLVAGWDQARLAAARVLVAGAGAVGNEVLKLFALIGVGCIVIVDFDRIERSNLSRTVLFREADAGKPKATAAAERLREINAEIDVRAIYGDLAFDLGLGVLRSMDLVVGCLDSIDARLALNRACLHAGVPWIDGGIEDTFAAVTLYDAGDGPCFECGMTPEMWAQRNQRFSCTGLRSGVASEIAPTTAVIASLAAVYIVNETLRTLQRPRSDVGLFGRRISVSLAPYSVESVRLARDPACLAHEFWHPVEVLPEAPTDIDVRALLTRLGEPQDLVELPHELLVSLTCARCGSTEPILLPVERCGKTLERCDACGADTRSAETVCWLDGAGELSNHSLAELGVPRYAVLAVKDGERRFVQLGGEYR